MSYRVTWVELLFWTLVAAAVVASVPAWASSPQQPQVAQQPQQPQQPQSPGTSSQQSTTVVVPPPAGQAPLIVEPRERPIQVVPCPETGAGTALAAPHKRPNILVDITRGAFLGAAAGAALGGLVGLASGHGRASDYKVDIGTGAALGFAAGGVAGGVLAYTEDDPHVAGRLTNRPSHTLALVGGRF